MAVTELNEIHKANWLERMSGSFKGVVTGFALVAGGVALLFWNEGRAVKTAKALAEGASAVVSVPVDRIDPANEGKLVHVSGKADTRESLEDADFGVKVTALSLSRSAEIFQWVEHQKTRRVKKGDKEYEETTYFYEQEWCDRHVDSGAFKEAGHANPPVEMRYGDAKTFAKEATLGAFRLTEDIVKGVGGAIPYAFPTNYVPPAALANAQVQGDTIYLPVAGGVAAKANVSPLLAAAQKAATNAVAAAIRAVATNPQIGDMRVRFSVVYPKDISLCQQQTGATFRPWKASNGRVINLQRDGVATADEMFASAKKTNKMITWALRVLGFLLLAGGFKGLFGPIETLVDVIPVLNGIVSLGVGLVSKLLAAVVWLLTVGVAWVFYRPVLGGALIACAVALIVLLVAKKKSAAKPAA